MTFEFQTPQSAVLSSVTPRTETHGRHVRTMDKEVKPTAPRVTESPDVIYLNYGDIERDDTHQECCAHGDVTWCEDPVFESDVQYVLGEHVDEMIAVAVAAERERCAKLCEAQASDCDNWDEGAGGDGARVASNMCASAIRADA